MYYLMILFDSGSVFQFHQAEKLHDDPVARKNSSYSTSDDVWNYISKLGISKVTKDLCSKAFLFRQYDVCLCPFHELSETCKAVSFHYVKS